MTNYESSFLYGQLENLLNPIDLENKNLPQRYLSDCILYSKISARKQYRIFTGEIYRKHLKEVGNIGKKIANPKFSNYIYSQFILHDYDENILQTMLKNGNESFHHFSPLASIYGNYGIVTGQGVRLMNKDRMKNYLEQINPNKFAKSSIEEIYFKSILGLSGNLGFPNIFKRFPESYLPSILIVNKMADLVSNLDRGKEIDKTFLEKRYNENSIEDLLKDIKIKELPSPKQLDKLIKIRFNSENKTQLFKDINCEQIENLTESNYIKEIKKQFKSQN